MKKNFKIATISYIILLSLLLGASLLAGVVVAPTIFYSELSLGSEILTHFQEGQMMTVVFLKLSYAVNVALLIIVLYEGYKYKKFERDTTTTIATFFVISTGLLFSQYYITDIISMQLAGEEMTKSVAFINTHKGSEINYKIFSLGLLVLIVQNMRKACK